MCTHYLQSSNPAREDRKCKGALAHDPLCFLLFRAGVSQSACVYVNGVFILKVPLLQFWTPVVLCLVNVQTLISSVQLRRRQQTVIAVITWSGNYAKKVMTQTDTNFLTVLSNHGNGAQLSAHTLLLRSALLYASHYDQQLNICKKFTFAFVLWKLR